ncbi:putative lipid II flippase FtsW [soil metagenome]
MLSFAPRHSSSARTAAPALRAPARYDRVLVCATAALILLGLVMVYSASIALPDAPKYANYSTYYFVMRHGIAIAVGLVAAVIAFQVPIHVWQKLAPTLFVVTLIALVLVLVPGIGKGVNGARRWIPLGPTGIQPSELMKLFCVMYAADFTVRKQAYMQDLIRGFGPMAIAMAAVAMLLMLEPDLGALMVIVAIAMGILFLGGINAKWFIGLSATLVSAFLAMIWFSPWRRDRIFAYLDVWEEQNSLGRGYQLSHSLIAFGRGEWFGVGLGASVEKMHYLPEAHTDFLLAVIGEELGFAGVAFVIGMFYLIVRRAFDIGRLAIALDRTYAGLVAHGIGLWIGVQAFINIGVNIGLLPTKGLTLPLMSYGGTGLLVNLVALAVLVRIDWETRRAMRGEGDAKPAGRSSREYRSPKRAGVLA